MDEIKFFQEKIVKVNGEVMIKKYQKGRQLGTGYYNLLGGFANCYQAISTNTQRKYAVKIIKKENLKKARTRQKLMSQIKIHKSLYHKNIVHFYHVFQDNNYVFILLQLCPFQAMNDLLKKRKKITQPQCQYFTRQIIQSLMYLHSNKIIHREYYSIISLKLGNLFIGDGVNIKLGDFGLATKLEFEHQKKRTICGTPNYIAPEVIEGVSGHSYQVDVWSLGVVIFTLLIGFPPFQTEAASPQQTYAKIKKCDYKIPANTKINQYSKQVIRQILVLNPAQRITLKQLLEHPFYNPIRGIPKSLPEECVYVQPVLKGDNFQETKFSQEKEIKKLSHVTSQKQILKKGNNILKQKQQRPLTRQYSVQNMQAKKQKVQNLCIKKNSNEWQIYIMNYLQFQNKSIGYMLSNGDMGIIQQQIRILKFRKNKNMYWLIQKNQITKEDDVKTIKDNNMSDLLIKRKTYFLKMEAAFGDLPYHNIDAHCYARKYSKTSQGILFRLSNKSLQTIFTDRSKLVITGDKNIIYVNKRGNQKKMNYQMALKSEDKQMQQRLKSTLSLVQSLKTRYNQLCNK